MQTMERTVDGWSGVIADLTAKANTCDGEVAELTRQRDALTLDAELGQNGAVRQLQKLLGEIAGRTSASASLRMAIQQARLRLEAARKEEAAEAERERRVEMSKLAAAAVRHAHQFTDSLRRAAEAGADLKLVLVDMLTRAAPEERPHLDHLLRPGPYMRCAEFAGLRAHLELPMYTGPKAHVVALEEELGATLERWLA